MTRRRLVAPLAVAATFLLAPSAHAVIVPQDNIAGVKVGMTAEKVLDVLGDPARTITNRDGITIYTYKRKGIKVSFKPNRANTHWVAFGISVYQHRRQLTAEGVGLGDTRRTVRKKVPGVKCHRYDPSYAICLVGSGKTGRISTTFWLNRRNKVKLVTLSKPFLD
jgi:hypothetical protein